MLRFVHSTDKTPCGKRYHYKTLVNGKANGYEIITDEKGNILRYIPWANGLKQGIEYTYDDKGNVESCCSYFEGLKYGEEVLYDNRIVKEIIYWDKGKKMSIEYYNKFGVLDKYTNLINKTGFEYYDNGQIRVAFTFEEHEYDRNFEEWHNEDGTLMTKREVDIIKGKSKQK